MKISPVFTFVQNAFCGLIIGGYSYTVGLIFGRKFVYVKKLDDL